MEDAALVWLTGKDKLGDSCTTNSDNQTSNKNNNENDKHGNNENNASDDGKGIHTHTSYAINKPGIVSEKWSNSQARMTFDAQSKVYNPRRKKLGRTDYSVPTYCLGTMYERQQRGFHKEKVTILQRKGPLKAFGNQMLQLSHG